MRVLGEPPRLFATVLPGRGAVADMRRDRPELPPAPPTVVRNPGMADEMWRQIAPLLAEDGIREGNTAPLDTLQQALERAVERRNMALFTPAGPARAAALTVLGQGGHGDPRGGHRPRSSVARGGRTRTGGCGGCGPAGRQRRPETPRQPVAARTTGCFPAAASAPLTLPHNALLGDPKPHDLRHGHRACSPAVHGHVRIGFPGGEL